MVWLQVEDVEGSEYRMLGRFDGYNIIVVLKK